jgi:ABC-type phosphate/phosphonate transport system substrate-binding protein
MSGDERPEPEGIAFRSCGCGDGGGLFWHSDSQPRLMAASAQLSPAEKAVVQKVLAGLHQDPEGKKLLAGLLIDRFIPLKEEWYDPIRAMHQHLARFKGTLHATQKP